MRLCWGLLGRLRETRVAGALCERISPRLYLGMLRLFTSVWSSPDLLLERLNAPKMLLLRLLAFLGVLGHVPPPPLRERVLELADERLSLREARLPDEARLAL